MQSGWQPADQLESNLAEALTRGDGQSYAKLVLEGPLYLPTLPERDSADWWELLQRITLTSEHVLAFTSHAAMSFVLGQFVRGYTKTDFTALAAQWRNPDWQLALNPGLPIGVVLPPAALFALARGEETLTPVADVRAELDEQADLAIRRICLMGLGGEERPAYAGMPVNELETALTAAVARQDGDEFLQTLLESEVVLPLSQPVADVSALTEADFPWHRIGADYPVVPVFSSTAVLDHVSADTLPRAELPFLTVLANWPDESHVLCFNPGTDTELVLFGDTVLELLAEIADSLSDRGSATR